MVTRNISLIIVFTSILLYPSQDRSLIFIIGKVVDLYSDRPIKEAVITYSGNVALTNENGMFFVKTEGKKLHIRAHGYLRADHDISGQPFIRMPLVFRLTPFTPKALYLTVYGIGDRHLRESALTLIEDTELNALVIDVKGDRGIIPYKSSIPLASEIGAQKVITVRDIRGLLTSLREKGIYTIARIVVFKDNLFARARHDLAIKTRSGALWTDGENLAWVDPAKKEVWNYNIDVAMEAARLGFDEIQFDYVRFPDAVGLSYSVPNTQENRTGAINGFLMEAKKKLAPYNVFLAADIFGYVCWNSNDTHIGQKIEDMAPLLDYISPMLYPSGFQFGIPGHRNPVARSYEIVYLSLQRAAERTNIPPVRFRPWLQAFQDYAFDRRQFTAKEIRAQINAAENFGSNGWMLWNPYNIYSPDGLKEEDSRI